MNKVSTLFLRLAILAIGTIILAICIFALPLIWKAIPIEFPDLTYVFYIITICLYLASLPFYFALFQAWKILNLIDKGKSFSELSVKSLSLIAYCAAIISVIFLVCLPLMYVWAQYEDAPGLVVIGMFFVVAPLTIAVFAGVLQRIFKEAIEIKSENELTV